MESKPQNSAPPVALFVFIPFCRIKCTYCDFNAYANMARLMDPYSTAVAKEIDAKRQELDGRLMARTIYFGGGTPSFVPAEHIEQILEACSRNFVVAAD